MKPKSFTLRAFSVDPLNNELGISSPPSLRELLESHTRNKTTVRDRLMVLNKSDPENERDVLASCSPDTIGVLTGTMLRVALGGDVTHIPESLLGKENFSFGDLKQEEINTSAICKDHYYFSLNDRFLVTTLGGNKTIKRLQTYLNWLVGLESQHFFVMTPLISPPPEIKITDISEAIFHDFSPSTSEERQKKILKVSKLKELLGYLATGNFFNDNEIESLLSEGVISAEVCLKIRKPKKMREEDFKRLLGKNIKPIADLDSVDFKTNKGKKVCADSLPRTKQVQIETTSSDRINEVQLIQEMRNFLNELEGER